MEKEKYYGQTIFSLFWCDFSPNEILIATLQLPTIYMFKSKIRIVKKKKKVGILCKSGFLPFSLPVGLVAFKTEQC